MALVCALVLLVAGGSWSLVVNATPPQRVDDTAVVGASSAFSSDPAIACSPLQCLAVWVDARLPGAIFGTVMAADGTMLIPTGVLIATSSLSLNLYPAVAFDGASFVVAWVENPGPVVGVRVSTLGVVLDPSPIRLTVSSTTSRPSLASAGGVTLLGWEDNRSAPWFDVYARRLGPALNALDAADVLISQVGGDSLAPAVGTDGSDFLVSYSALRVPFFRRVSAAGLVGSATALGTSGDDPTVSFGGGVYLVSWSIGVEVIGARVDPLGSLLGAPFSISATGGGTQRNPGSGFSNGEFLVAWVVEFGGPQPWDVMGRRVAPDGTLLEPVKFALGSTTGLDDRPAVASAGLTFFTIWSANGATGFSTLTALGARLSSVSIGDMPTAPFPLALSANTQKSASIATNGAESLAVWVDHRGSLTDLYAMPLSTLGLPQRDAGVPLCTNAANRLTPRVAFNGTTYFAVWSDWRAGVNAGIYGARISASGTVLDPNGVNLTSQTSLRLSPAVAPIDAGFLVVWGDGRNASFDVYATRVSPGGAVLDGTGFVVSSTPAFESSPRLSSLGPLALVAWQNSALMRVVAARVASDGTVLDPSGISLPFLGGQQSSPTVTNDGARFLVVWLEAQADGGIDVAGTRVAADGTVLDPSGLSISTTPGRRTWPEATFDGARYVVSWHTDRGREGVLVSPQGVVTGAEFSIAPDALNDSAGQASTSTPGVTAVAYSAFDSRTGYSASRIRSKFIEVLDASVDAGTDAGSTSDAGSVTDAGSGDAGAPSDAGSFTDAGSGVDAGVGDAGQLDAGLAVDGGQADGGGAAPDAGETPDAGTGTRALQVGCGCELSAGGGGGGWALAVICLSALRMRRWRGHLRPARCRRSCRSGAPR